LEAVGDGRNGSDKPVRQPVRVWLMSGENAIVDAPR